MKQSGVGMEYRHETLSTKRNGIKCGLRTSALICVHIMQQKLVGPQPEGR